MSDLEYLDEHEGPIPPVAIVKLAKAIEHLAEAIEGRHATHAAEEPPHPATVAASGPVPATCPEHHEPWKFIAAGVSKKTGKPYDAFYVCKVDGCPHRPS